MEKSNDFSGDVEDYSCEPPTFERFANLREQELNQLVEKRHSALRDGLKKQQQTGLYQPFKVSNA